MMLPMKAAIALGSANSRSGVFEYNEQRFTGIRVLSRDRATGIKDCELSRIDGAVGDVRIFTKIISGSQIIGVADLATAT